MSDIRDNLQRVLGAAYTIQRELGGGGMSRVFLARDESLGRDVVLKLLMPELASTLSAERFTREIKMVASLQEPHIVPVLAAGQTADGLPWFTMPYVSGESLRARLTRGPVSAVDALGILRNVAQALAYARARRGPPRHQAGERAAIQRHGGGSGLRDRESVQRVAHAVRRERYHASRDGRGNAGVHGAGTGHGRSEHGPSRRCHVCSRRRM